MVLVVVEVRLESDFGSGVAGICVDDRASIPKNNA